MIPISFLLSFLILQTPNSHTEQQLFEAIQQRKALNWNEYESPRDDAWMTSILQNNPQMMGCFDNKAEQIKDFVQYFHFYDFNLDGLQDVIYQGPCKPYMQTYIFMQDEEGFFHFKVSHSGTANFLKIEDNQVYLSIFSEACCCTNHSSMTFYQFDNSMISPIKRRWLQVDLATEIPSSKTTGKLFTTTHLTLLRSTPKIDNTIQTHVCFDEPKVKGNVVNEYEKDASGYVFAEKQDEQGNLWYFVIFAPNNISLASDYYYFVHVDGVTYAMGWVQADDITFTTSN